jgi:hypothetical protein
LKFLLFKGRITKIIVSGKFIVIITTLLNITKMKAQYIKFKNKKHRNNSILFFFLLSVLILFNSCNKEKREEERLVNQLPPATESGEDIFACIVNDRVWIAEDRCCGLSKLSISYDDNGDYFHGEYYFSMYGSRSTNWGLNVERIRFHLEPIKEKGIVDFSTLQVAKITYEIRARETVQAPEVITTYQLNKGSDVHFEITKLDSGQMICSGNFSFQLTNTENDTDKITVSHGRFDGIYHRY